MNLGKTLMLTSLCLALAACSVSTRSVSIAPVKPPAISRPDSKLLTICALPIDIGNGPLSQANLEELWIADRQSLLDCYRRHLALRNFVIDRDDALRGLPVPTARPK